MEVIRALENTQKRVKELEKRLSKDSHNSSLPPSSDRFGRKRKNHSLRKPSGKKAGGQPGHPGQALSQVEHPDQKEVTRWFLRHIQGLFQTGFYLVSLFLIKRA
jgi:hypothetical protein